MDCDLVLRISRAEDDTPRLRLRCLRLVLRLRDRDDDVVVPVLLRRRDVPVLVRKMGGAVEFGEMTAACRERGLEE